MKFSEDKEGSTTKKQYPKVNLTGKLEKSIKSGSTNKGVWEVFKFNQMEGTAIFFAGSKEEYEEMLNGIEIGDTVELEFSGSRKGNVLKNIRKAEGDSSPSHQKLSDEDLSAFVPSFICGYCGKENLWLKDEMKPKIEKLIKEGKLSV